MHIRRVLLLVGALLALTAFAAPGGAAAYQITDNEESVESAEFESTGQMVYESAFWMLECTVHERVSVKGAGTSVSTEFTANTCVGSGALAGCEVESVTDTAAPVSAAATESGLEFSEELDFVFDEGCGIDKAKTVTKTFEFQINDEKKTKRPIWGWEKESTTECTVLGLEIEETGTGLLEVTGADSETYEVA